MKTSLKTCEEAIQKTEKKQVSAHLDIELIKRVSIAATASHRTLSGQIAFLLEQGLTKLSDEEKRASGLL